MRFTYIAPDRVAIVDGAARQVPDLEPPAGVHAIQWDGSTGHVEYALVDGIKPPNAPLASIAAYQPILDAWATVGAPPAQPEPRPTQKPDSIPAWAAKAILHEDGLLDAAEAAAAASGGAWPLRFAYAATWARADMLAIGTGALSLTEAAVDAMIDRARVLAAT